MFGLRYWKWITILLLFYTLMAGFLTNVPKMPILHESIRNLYFHVPMWFGMLFLFATSVYHSVKYLRNQRLQDDLWAVESANIGVVFGVLGLLTGAVWANYTWGEPWSNDPKQVNSAIALLIYLAYLVLRGSVGDATQKARLSAVYNIFAFATLIPLLFILPRMNDSLHPGNGGNPGFNSYDLDSRMRMIFYPAVIAWSMLGWWITELSVRVRKINNSIENEIPSDEKKHFEKVS
jgi:heme exporter protein C